MIKCSIITIGDELLIGQVIDTNSAWIAKELNKVGLAVVRRVAVGDDENSIVSALNEEAAHSDVILITGGLGPTNDDITKQVLCKYFGATLIVNEEVLAHITNLFENIFKKPLTAVNRKQAEVPDCCTVIPNQLGSAPAMMFTQKATGNSNVDKLFISMPGVPQEMKGIMENSVIPMISKKYCLFPIAHRTLLTVGIGESMLAAIIKDFEDKLPPTIKLAYLPNFSMVRLRLSSTVTRQPDLVALEDRFSTLQQLVKEYLVTNEDETMEAVLSKILLQHDKFICTAESCTGGYIAHLLTSIVGSSAFYKGSIIAYSDNLKKELLHVKDETLAVHGAVSNETVREMAAGCLAVLDTDYAMAVSGIMGPGGGSEEKPVGTVWMAVASRNKTITQKIHLRFNRKKNIELASLAALNMARLFILSEEQDT